MLQIIVETAKMENFDLIVLGHKGMGGLKHLMLGSVAEGVCGAAPCLVLMVRQKTSVSFLRKGT